MTLVAGIESGHRACKVVVRDMATGKLMRTGVAAHPDKPSLEARLTSIHNALDAAGSIDDVSAISITSSPNAFMLLDAGGHVVSELMGDARTAAFLITGVGAAVFAGRTGSVPSATTALAGLRKLREADHDVVASAAMVVSVADWLSWRLRGGEPGSRGALDSVVTDRSQASTTGYFDIVRNRYDDELARIGLGRILRMPQVIESGQRSGATPDGLVVGAGCSYDGATALGMALRNGDLVIDMNISTTLMAQSETPTHDPSGSVVCRSDATDGFLVRADSGDAISAIADLEQLMGAPQSVLVDLALAAQESTGGLRFDGSVLQGIGLGGFTAPNLVRSILEGVLREQWRAASPVVAHGVAVNRLVLQGKYASVLAQVCESAIPVSVQVQVPSEFAADGAALQAAWALQGSRPGWTPGLIN